MAERARPYLASDPEFQTLLSDLVIETTIVTDPPGATVYSKPYEEPDAPWEMIGTTPIERLVAPIIYTRFKVEKPGFETLIDVRMPGDMDFETDRMVPDTIEWKLHETGVAPAGMVLVLGDDDLSDFWVDRYEVTNRQFKEFVDLGGYSTADYWKFEFVKDGTILSGHKVMTLLLLHLLEDKGLKGGVVQTICGTALIDKICRAYGLKTYETKVGFWPGAGE